MKKFNSNSISRNNKYNGAGGAGGGGTASDIAYDNSLSGLVSENVQQAIDELHDEIELGAVYSTDEVQVGEWTDGKALYRKVVETTGKGDVSTGLTNADVKYIEGFLTTNKGIKLPLSIYVSAQYYSITQIKDEGATLSIDISTGWTPSVNKAEVIMYYTK